jgi:flagellar biosynthetic protein FlhB
MAGERTEAPTQRRIDRARREGQFPVSREFLSAVQFCGFVLLVIYGGATYFQKMLWGARALSREAFQGSLTQKGLVSMLYRFVLPQALPLLFGGMAMILLVVLAQLVNTGFGLSLARAAPDFKRLAVTSKLKNLPAQNLTGLGQAVVLLALVCCAAYYEIKENLDVLLQMPLMSVSSGVAHVAAAVQTLLLRAGAAVLVIGAFDLLWQRRRFRNQLKMSKQEVREEAKEQQGNPQVKMRIRRLQRDLARRQMMKELPKATAVVVNPTHYAVALHYSAESGGAPRVIAKGRNFLALRIRERAIQLQIPIVENPPLARALYQAADVGQEIPVNLYRAVAEVLAYIYRLMSR